MQSILPQVLAALLLMGVGSARAENEFEQRIREVQARNPGYSLVFIEVRLNDESSKPLICRRIDVILGSDHATPAIRTQNEPLVLGFEVEGATYGGAGLLAPGTYDVRIVGCGRENFRGDFARFRIGPNEIINAGSLVIDIRRNPRQLFSKATFTSRNSVEDLSQRAKKSLTERSPAIFPKATKRNMAPIQAAFNSSPQRSER